MATEMKQLLALLLLGCVFAVHGSEEGDEKKDPCTQGLAAIQLFFEYRGCADPNPYDTAGSRLQTLSNNMTVHNINNTFTDFCSTMFPRIKQCFLTNVENCSLDERNSLTRVVQQTGFVCQPNASTVHPVIKHSLAKLTDVDLAENASCNTQFLSPARMQCFYRSLEAIGVSPTNSSNPLKGLSMEQLVPKIQTFTRTMFACVVSMIHAHLSSCPQWRGIAIRTVRMLILPPVLGKSMPFTAAELDRLFQWQSGGQSQQSGEQNFLLNLLK